MQDFSSPVQMYCNDGEILVRTTKPSDAYMLAGYFQQNRTHLKPWEPERGEDFYRVDTWASKLLKLDELHRRGKAYYCIIIELSTQQMIGTVSFSHLARFPIYSCNLGYSLAQTAQGQGYMQKALALALPYMFDIQQMHRINASYMPSNHRSAAVLKSMGFQQEGLAKDYLLIDGQWQDHVLTALVNPNWQVSA